MDVACLLIPDFLVALARRDDPALVGREVIIGGSPGEHTQVAACSREAAAAGVVSGTTLRRALSLCPNAVFLPLQEGQAQAEAAQLLDLLRGYSPAVEVIAPGHAHIDTRGLARMAGLEDNAWLAELHEAACGLSGLAVQMAGAETVFAAHAAASVLVAPEAKPPPRQSKIQNPKSKIHAPIPNSIVVPEGGAKRFLARLPVEVLPVAPLMHQRLRLFGLERLGQVAGLTLSAMQAQFGPDGRRAWQLANGRDDARVVPGRDELRITEALELPAPAALLEPLLAGTKALLQRATNRPEARAQPARKLEWRLALESGEQLQRRLTFREPTADVARMLAAVRARIERLQLPAAAVGLEITLSGLCSEYGHQANLWPVGPRRWRELLEAVEHLNARVGSPQVYRITEVQPWSRIPERQLGLVAFGPLNQPRPAAVEPTPGGNPAAMLWRGRYLRVTAIHDRWRIDDEWWRDEVARRYFEVELENGRRLTVYHDLVSDAWYEQTYDHIAGARQVS